jgi:hypothetical protein
MTYADFKDGTRIRLNGWMGVILERMAYHARVRFDDGEEQRVDLDEAVMYKQIEKVAEDEDASAVQENPTQVTG